MTAKIGRRTGYMRTPNTFLGGDFIKFNVDTKDIIGITNDVPYSLIDQDSELGKDLIAISKTLAQCQLSWYCWNREDFLELTSLPRSK